MELSILFVNDVHGYLEPHAELFYHGGTEIISEAGGYAAIAGKIAELRKAHPNTLVFDGGDTFHGTMPVVQSKGEVLIPILNKIGFNAMVGHWDFAYGPDHLKYLAGQLHYPVLAINVYNSDGGLFLKPYILLTVSEIKVAVIGICANIIDKTMPKQFSRGIEITDGLEELPGVINKVREEGADITILLSHNGFPQDVALLKKVSGIDVCLSAHTHNRLYEAVEINNTVIIQCGCHGSFLGALLLNIERGKIKTYAYDLHTINESTNPDEQVATMVKEAMLSFGTIKEEVVGSTASLLHRYNTLNSSLDELLLKAIAQAAGVSVAFSNGWRYGVPIPRGNITKWNLYNIVPMNPTVETVELSGDEILAMLEENLERTFSAEPFNQMGGYVKRCTGLGVKLRIENPNGHRIQQVFVDNEPLSRAGVYTVAFITSQGVPHALGKNRKRLSITAVEAMEAYLKQHSPFRSSKHPTFSLI